MNDEERNKLVVRLKAIENERIFFNEKRKNALLSECFFRTDDIKFWRNCLNDLRKEEHDINEILKEV